MVDLDFVSNETVTCRTMTITSKSERGKCFLHAQCDGMDFVTTTTETAVLIPAGAGEDLIDAAYRANISIDGVC